MKLVVALGNPGARYARTRHNIGFRVAECFCTRHRIELASERFSGRFGQGRLADEANAPDLTVSVLLPGTYMNLSGDAVLPALAALGIQDVSRDLVVVFDDVDLPFARLRVRARGGAGGHRGVAHIIERLGRNDFARLRFGVGRPGDASMATKDYVLEPFGDDEERELPGQLIRGAQALETVLRAGAAVAMNEWNRDPTPEATSGA